MQLTIEKMIYGGDGLARDAQPGEPRGKTVFVPFVLKDEQVEAEITEEKSGFARARAETIISASPFRVAPPCPYFLQCGGCHYQHASYEHQLEIKTAILRETLLRTGKVDWQNEILVHPSPPWNYRNRTQMKVRHDPFAIGYYKFNSHVLLPVEQCPISSPLINKAIAAIWQLGRSDKIPKALIEIEFFANAKDQELMLKIDLHQYSMPAQEEWQSFAAALLELVTEIAGISLFTTQADGPRIQRKPPKELLSLFGLSELVYGAAFSDYRVSAGSFFQTNRFMTDTLVKLVTKNRSGKFALDLYAGVGLFSKALAKPFPQVSAVESAALSYSDLKNNCPLNATTYNLTTEQFLASVPRGTYFDYIVADPPRAGLGEKVTRQIAQLAPAQMTYVSCDPATLARDLKVLLASGYRISKIHLVDLFPQTYHIETVIELAR